MTQAVEKSEGFEVRSGNIITVPVGFEFEESLNKRSFPETPIALILYEVSGLCFFKCPTAADKKFGQFGPEAISAAKRFLVFVSGNIKAGDRLLVQWAEGRCACAKPVEYGTRREVECPCKQASA